MQKNTIQIITALLITLTSLPIWAQPTESFSKAKKVLLSEVYFDHKKTLYCAANFDEKKAITLPAGYSSSKYIKRSKRVEWEHVVPAENFGRTFSEWRDGSDKCINKKGNGYKGRRCANKASSKYRLMQSDLYNLYPAIGSVNAMRSNYNFTMLPGASSDFGSCQMKIENRKAEPPKQARGRIARTYLYMEQKYRRYNMSKKQRQLMSAWDKQYPVSEWECLRNDRIKRIQETQNSILEERCLNKSH